MKIKNNWIKLGSVGVDSGQLLICDPCYINTEWKKDEYGQGNIGDFSYGGCCKTTETKRNQLHFEMGHAGSGVVFNSGYGDGCYEVWGRLKENRIVEVKILMG